MLFDDRHGLPALQAGAKPELCFYVRRRLEPAPGGGRRCALQMRIFMPAELQIRQDEGHCP
jgi:hypothetical protein